MSGADDLLTFIDLGLTDAAALARRGGNRRDSTVKPGDRNQVVTATDLAIGRMVVERIRKTYPADSVIDEESGVWTGSSGRVWVVDPIDGTSNYAAGSPLYGCMMALLTGDGVQACGVTLPAFGTSYLAALGGGVRCNGVPLEAATPRPMAEHLVAYGLDLGGPAEMAPDWALLQHLAPRIRGLRMSNSVFDAVQVVTGVYGAYLHRRMQVWDIAPLHLLVTESGGACTDLDGQALRYAVRRPADLATRTYAVCLTAPGVEAEVRRELRPAAAG